MKPCPFCGSIDIRSSQNNDEHLFWCGNCGALGPNDISFEYATQMWNLRRPTADLLAACEAARDWLYTYHATASSVDRALNIAEQIDTAIASARGEAE